MPSGIICSTSGCIPAATLRQSTHSLHPPFGQTRDAAKARANVLRPLPGGPVISQA